MKQLAMAACLASLCCAGGWSQAPENGSKCVALAKVSLPHTAITKAEITAPGSFVPPKSPDSPNSPPDPVFAKLPAFCHVAALATPSSDSSIPIEVWLPVTGWNGRFLGVGNGGFAGSIAYDNLAVDLLRGYATAATDTGHQASGIDASWALGHPEKIADFGWRAIHEMTLTGEALTEAFYGHGAAHRYFASCSDGGREALMEAQRFPSDYDGILAGAPAYHWTHLLSGALYAAQALEGKPESYIPTAKLAAIHDAVLAQCGDKHDGFVEDPRQCRFDPSVLLCRTRNKESCLTSPQLIALRALYAGPRTRNGTPVNPGETPGAELSDGGWEPWITGSRPKSSALWGFATGYFDSMVYDKAGLDILTLDPDAAFDLAVRKTASDLDAANPDLSAFDAHGGKLILYHGWNDPAIPATGTIDYYNQVLETLGDAKTESFARLFLVPGMQHCDGGPGITNFGQGGPSQEAGKDGAENNIYRALEAWVENGRAPEKVNAAKELESKSKPGATITRPVCAYPKAAVYSGRGSRKSAESYACKAKE